MSAGRRRVLVVGASGMLGREVAAAADADVVRASRTERQGWIRFDAETDDVRALLAAAGDVELIVNCAAVLAAESAADPVRAELVNARFPRALAEAADARVVHISTDAVFRDDAGRCLEDDGRFADDAYSETKRRGEPLTENAISLRCSFVGLDPERRRGLLEWLLAQPAGAEVAGYADQLWNGLTSTQVAAVCAALQDPDLFARARAEGPVHHLFEDPPLSKHDLLASCARLFDRDLRVVAAQSGRPVTRTLGTRRTALRGLESVPRRVEALGALAERGRNE